MENEKRMKDAIKHTVNYCMNDLNFADEKWDDKNFLDYEETDKKES